MGLIADAIERSEARQEKRIDYAEMNRVWPIQKRALKRAVKTGDPEKVAQVVKEAVEKWDEIGSWPDDWSLFQRTLDDVLPWNQQVDIRDL